MPILLPLVAQANRIYYVFYVCRAAYLLTHDDISALDLDRSFVKKNIPA